MRFIVLAAWLIAAPAVAAAQQVPDTAFAPPIGAPAFPGGQGPAVLVDEAHANFHTAAGRYRPFADLLRRDGFVVTPSTTAFTPESLEGARVLVIANAGARAMSPPTGPSAFTPAEIAAVRDWVASGGSLLLIVDHAPLAAPAAALGRAVGVRLHEGFVRRENAPGPLVFRKADGTLKAHPITEGVDEVATFTGSSFELDARGTPLLVLGPATYSYSDRGTNDPISASGRLQGAVLALGKGRIAVFGEAAMFTAQLAGPAKNPMGMNAPAAKQNPRFLLNLMHWLAGLQ